MTKSVINQPNQIPIIISDLIITLHRIDRFPQLIDHHNHWDVLSSYQGWTLSCMIRWERTARANCPVVFSPTTVSPRSAAWRGGDGGKVVLSERVWQDNVKHGVHPSRRKVISEGPLEDSRPLANLTECSRYTRLRERARPGGSASETAVHRVCLQSTSSVSESLSPVSLHRKRSALQKSDTSDSEPLLIRSNISFWTLCYVLRRTYDYSIRIITSI